MSEDKIDNFSRKADFSSTHWSVVRAAGEQDSAAAAVALQRLCQIYWYPLYAYVRRQGYDADSAADLTQAFFADLLQREDIKKADPAHGKFRSFLLASLKHFLSNQRDKARSQKRGGGVSQLSLDFETADSRYQLERPCQLTPSNNATPELLYEKQWAKTLLERVQQSLRSEFAERGKSQQFETLQGSLAGKDDEQSMADVAAKLDMTEVAARVLLHRMRRRFAELLRLEISQTVSNSEDVDAEIRQLFEVLRK